MSQEAGVPGSESIPEQTVAGAEMQAWLETTEQVLGAMLGTSTWFSLSATRTERTARDERWRQNEYEAKLFQIRMGYERAKDKMQFMKRYVRWA